jgi:dihydroorotate dehydrogenase (NAD+) catalytic subunit
MLNSIGLMNPGWDGFVTTTLPRIRELPCPFVLNVAGKSEDEFVELTRRAGQVTGFAALELNLSCPNVSGGLDFSASPETAGRIVRRCREVASMPIWAKLSPNVGDIVPIAKACEDAGATALSLVNTYLGTAIDWRKRKTIFSREIAGLSGPAIKPMALLAVLKTSRAVKIPVIGIGGIMNASDALEFLAAGATAVQVGTACFLGPDAPVRLAEEMAQLLAAEGIADVRDVIGSVSRTAAGSLGTAAGR